MSLCFGTAVSRLEKDSTYLYLMILEIILRLVGIIIALGDVHLVVLFVFCSCHPWY